MIERLSVNQIPTSVYRDVPVFPVLDENSCALDSLRSSIAYFEAPYVPDWTELSEGVNRQDGEGVLTHEVALFLLGRGYEVISMSDFDEERLKVDKLPYLEQYYRVKSDNPAWDPASFYDVWTPDNVEAFVADTSEIAQRFAAHALYRHIQKRPTVHDIRALLTDYLVRVELTAPGDLDCTHASVVTGFSTFADPVEAGGGQFNLVMPSFGDNPAIYISPFSSFQKEWLAEEGIYAFRTPDSSAKVEYSFEPEQVVE